LLRAVYELITRGQEWPPPIPFPPISPSTTIVKTPPATVDLHPTPVGAPGAEAIQGLLDWLSQYALWGCVAAVVAGGGLFAWARRTGGHSMAVTGTALAGGGAVGAILVGLAPEIVNTLYRHALGG
jgi:hypothetical protein